MAFKILLQVLNAIILILNQNNYRIYDSEDTSYYISGIKYNKEEDKIYFKCKEE